MTPDTHTSGPPEPPRPVQPTQPPDAGRVYPEDLLRRGGKWLGAVRNQIKWIRCGFHANGESVRWGSNEELRPPLTMREVEELAAHAAAAALNEQGVVAERERCARICQRALGASSSSDARRWLKYAIARICDQRVSS